MYRNIIPAFLAHVALTASSICPSDNQAKLIPGLLKFTGSNYLTVVTNESLDCAVNYTALTGNNSVQVRI